MGWSGVEWSGVDGMCLVGRGDKDKDNDGDGDGEGEERWGVKNIINRWRL